VKYCLLCCQAKQTLDDFYLQSNRSLFYFFNLAFTDHIHCLISLNRSSPLVHLPPWPADYAWKSRSVAPRSLQNQALTQQIQQVYAARRGAYGSPRVYAALRHKGIMVGRHRVARLMREFGLHARIKAKFRITTVSDPALPVVGNRWKTCSR